jgi:hypothetical protein
MPGTECSAHFAAEEVGLRPQQFVTSYTAKELRLKAHRGQEVQFVVVDSNRRVLITVDPAQNIEQEVEKYGIGVRILGECVG